MNINFWSTDTSDVINQLQNTLTGSYTLRTGQRTPFKASLWDSIDHQLIRDNQVILKKGNLWQVWNLTEFIPSGIAAHKSLSENTPRFWNNFEEGEFSFFLKEKLDRYSINKVTDLKWEETAGEILNKDGKIIAKILFNTINNHLLARLSGLKGYEKEFKKIRNCFSQSGCRNLQADWFNTLMKENDITLFKNIPLTEILATGDEPIRRAVSDIILKYIHNARVYEAGMIQDLDTECCHNYRVSIRKIRSFLSIIKNLYPESDCIKLKEELKKIQKKTSLLRDLDVYLMEKENYTAMLPEAYRVYASSLFNQASDDRKKALLTVRRYIRSQEYKEKISFIESYFEGAYQLPHTKESRKTSREIAEHYSEILYKKMALSIKRIDKTTMNEELHKLRITGKKLRYVLEFFTPILDENSRNNLIKALKKLQDDLGRFNDLSVQMETLAEKAAQPAVSNRENLLLLGILMGVIHHQYEKQRVYVIENISKFTSHEIRAIAENLTGKTV